MFENVDLYFNFLKRFFPGRGYYPEPSKSVLIMHPENIEPWKSFGLRHGFKVCFIGDNESKYDRIKERTQTWDQKIHKVSETKGKYPQESYFAIVRNIQ